MYPNLDSANAFEFYRTFFDWYCKWANPHYLEVGCGEGGLTGRLASYCKSATGIDVSRYPTWTEYQERTKCRLIQISSDEYFKSINPSITYDLIFIDADHTDSQVIIDFENSLMRLSPDGLIALHDTYPPNEEATGPAACGTAWRARILYLESLNLQVFTFPVTFGLTLVGRHLGAWANGYL